MSKTINQWMKHAINDAQIGINNGDGGPFGAVIIQNNKLIASAHNHVLKTNDPSAHAEIMAIRNATHKLQTPHLTNCELYTTCEPCPMCWGAIYWSRISTIYYGCTNQDAGKLGFLDETMHQTFNIQHPKSLKITQINHKECLELFENWDNQSEKTLY